MFARDPLLDLPVGIQMGIRIVGTLMLVMGGILLLSPPQRFENVGWSYALQIFDHIQVAGAIYLALGVAVFVARSARRGVVAALVGCAVYLTFWAVLSALTFANYTNTTMVGVVLYGGYALGCYAIIATIYQWRRLRGF